MTLTPVAGFADQLRPGPTTIASASPFWEGQNEDAWFLWEGALAPGTYLLRFDGAVEGGPEKSSLRVYFGPNPAALCESQTLNFWPLGNNPRDCRRELILNLPEGAGALRIDPLAAPRRFSFANAALLRSGEASERLAAAVLGAELPFSQGIGSPARYDEDGLTSQHNSDFVQDPLFARAYDLGKATGSWGSSELRWRVFVSCWAAERCAQLEGDFVECGVNRGGFARSVIHFTDFPKLGKHFYLLDTFRGLDERLVTQAERLNGILLYRYDECFEDVQKTFAQFPCVKLIRGSVPDTLPLVPSQKVAFLSLDMNCAAPEIAAAAYFWDKMPPGAVIVLDDYGWGRHLEQKKAFDIFAAERSVRVLPLPTGQGLIVKGGGFTRPTDDSIASDASPPALTHCTCCGGRSFRQQQVLWTILTFGSWTPRRQKRLTQSSRATRLWRPAHPELEGASPGLRLCAERQTGPAP